MPLLSRSRDEWPSAGARVPSWEDLRSSLWFWPFVAAVVSFAGATFIGSIHPTAGSRLANLAWPGDRESATAFLQVVAGSVITVTSLTFTLVVVALQLASQQFSPRLLREFARDPITQVVLAILVSTFAVSVTVLRSLDEQDPLPSLGLGLAFVMTLLSIAALLGFVGHISRLVRVDTMMAAVHRETRRTLEENYVAYGDESDRPSLPDAAHDAPDVVFAKKSGFVQRVHVDAIVACADRCDGVVVLGIRPGDHITVGTPIARLLVTPAQRDALADGVHDALELGYERTLEQDMALGLRQLTDIAVKALSPGINDPTTASHAMGHVADLLVRMLGRRLGPVVHAGASGVARVQAEDHDLRYYLDTTIGPVRRYAAGEPIVLCALMRVLRDVAVSARDEEHRGEVRRQADLVEATMSKSLLGTDKAAVRDVGEQVRAVLDGDVLAAFADRAGETRTG